MRWWTRPMGSLLSLAMVVFGLRTEAVAEQPNLIQRSQCGHFLLVLGRLRLDESRYNKLRREEAIEGDDAGTEYVSVTAERGVPSLHYLRQSQTERISIDVAHARHVTIERTVLEGEHQGQAMRIVQPRDGLVQWQVSLKPGKPDLYQAESLWHLYAMQPKAFEFWVAPLLREVIPTCAKEIDLDAIDDRLISHCWQSPEGTLEWEQFAEWVAQLGATKRTARAEAQSAMVACGVGILPLLNMLDMSTLDAEQRDRIQSIRMRLEPRGSDSSESVSRWLANDYRYWEHAARRWQLNDRQRASQRLQVVCGKSLPMPLLLPMANEADVTTEVAAAPTLRR